MGTNIITGYTGTRHITPAMDAAVYRSAFGQNNYILSDGNQLAGSMPDINSFTVLDGLVSMQGHQVQITQETLSVDTCANDYSRIDLVCLRFEHDNNTSVDSASLVVIKGTEVQEPNTPSVPEYNEGIIDSGASVVDMPLYQINLSGSTVTFSQSATLLPMAIEEITEGVTNATKLLQVAAIYDSGMSLSLSTSNKVVPLNSEYKVTGDFAKTSTGGVRVLRDGLVEITGSITMSGLNATDVAAALVSGSIGGVYQDESSSTYTTGTTSQVIVLEHVINATAGEIIFFRARNTTAARGSVVAGKMTVTYL